MIGRDTHQQTSHKRQKEDERQSKGYARVPAALPLDLARSAAIEVMIGGLNVLESVGRESMVHDESGWKVAPRIGLVYNSHSISAADNGPAASSRS